MKPRVETEERGAPQEINAPRAQQETVPRVETEATAAGHCELRDPQKKKKKISHVIRTGRVKATRGHKVCGLGPSCAAVSPCSE